LNTLGCICGTLGTSFYLVPLMGIRSIFFLLAGMSLFCAVYAFLSWKDAGLPVSAERHGA
jgi:hypothetical protein